MADESAFGAAIKQLDNVWDWAAFIGGCGAGFFAHAHLGDTTFYSVPGTGLAAVGFRRATVGAMRRPSLKKKAGALSTLVGRDTEGNPLKELARQLDSSFELWNTKLLTNEQFEEDMVAIVTRYKQLKAVPLPTPVLPAPQNPEQ